MKRAVLNFHKSDFGPIDWLRNLEDLFKDLWICFFPTVAVVTLLVIVFRTEQAQEVLASFKDVLLYGSQQEKLFGVLTGVLTAFGVAYCAAAILFASASALGTARHRSTSVAYWLASFCLVSASGVFLNSSWSSILVVFLAVSLLVLRALGFAVGTLIVQLLRRVGALSAAARRLHHITTDHGHPIARWLLISGAAVLAAMWTWPVPIGRFLTTWPSVYLAAGWWTLFLSLVSVTWPRTHNLRSLWFVPAVLVVIFSLWNDDHTVSRSEGGRNRSASLSLNARAWMLDHCRPSRDLCAVRFIAVHGGGQRALYWTQAVLRALKREIPEFDNSVYAVSTISGGSIGALAYYLASSGSCGPLWEKQLQRFAEQDNLAPIVAALGSRDVAHMLLPVWSTYFDRSLQFDEGLQTAWQYAFRVSHCPDAMASSFPYGLQSAPALFLNATRVEDGERFVFSSVTLPKTFKRAGLYVFDESSEPDVWPVSNAAAAHISSRFSYVNPHASILYRSDAKVWGRLVDGGYHDDTGLTTLFELLDDFAATLRDCPSCPNVKVQIVYINSDARSDDQLDGYTPPPSPGPTPQRAPFQFLWGLFTPPQGFLDSAWNARDERLRERVLTYLISPGADGTKIKDVTAREISLFRMASAYDDKPESKHDDDWQHRFREQKPALAWWLSPRSRGAMDHLLEKCAAISDALPSLALDARRIIGSNPGSSKTQPIAPSDPCASPPPRVIDKSGP